MLAMQEFAVYEPTGISVVATEVRMVFETGAYSSPDNPITQQFGFGSNVRSLPDQPARAAAAIATAMPLLGVVTVLAIAAFVGSRKLSAAENVDTGGWPRALDAPVSADLVSWLVFVVALVVPIVGLIGSLK